MIRKNRPLGPDHVQMTKVNCKDFQLLTEKNKEAEINVVLIILSKFQPPSPSKVKVDLSIFFYSRIKTRRQINFSSQHFSIENSYLCCLLDIELDLYLY